MHAFDIRSADRNHACVLGLSRDLFHILQNTPTVVGITHRRKGCERRIYAWFIRINICRGNELCRDGGGRCESYRAAEDVIEVIRWSLI